MLSWGAQASWGHSGALEKRSPLPSTLCRAEGATVAQHKTDFYIDVSRRNRAGTAKCACAMRVQTIPSGVDGKHRPQPQGVDATMARGVAKNGQRRQQIVHTVSSNTSAVQGRRPTSRRAAAFTTPRVPPPPRAASTSRSERDVIARAPSFKAEKHRVLES